MTAFNFYYHSLELWKDHAKRRQLHELNSDFALEKCDQAYQGMAHDLELIFAADGILEQMCKAQAYWSVAAKEKIKTLSSVLLKESLLKIYDLEKEADSKDHLKKELTYFLENTQNYLMKNTVATNATDKFSISILKQQKIVSKYSPECHRQIDLVDYLIRLTPFLDDAEVFFAKNGLMDSLTDAVNEIANFEIASNQVLETETLKSARHKIIAQCGKLKTRELRSLVGQACRSTLNINNTDHRNVFQELAFEAWWLSGILKDWHNIFSTKSKIQTKKITGNPEYGADRQLSAEWLKTAIVNTIVRHADLVKITPDTSNLFQASEKLRLVSKFKFSDLSPSKWPIQIQSRFFGSTVLKQYQSQLAESSASSSSSQTEAPKMDEFFESMADAVAEKKPKKPPKPAKNTN